MSRPASFGRLVAAQALVETRLTARRGENVLAMVVLPVAALAIFGGFGPAGGREIATRLPGVLALALVASGLVNLGIATAFERGYGVLKRLGGSPLGRDGLLVAKLVVVSLIGLVQVGALVAIAVILGWQPGPSASPGGVLVAVVVGSATFAALGLLLAGAIRPEATLVGANALFLVALLLGGVIVSVPDLPGPLAALAMATPFGALAQAFGAALAGDPGYLPAVAIVAAWGVAAAALTAITFRWD